MVSEKSQAVDGNFKIGALLLCAGFLAALAGFIPILGLLVQTLSPNIFFIGLVLIAIGVAKLLCSNKLAIGGLAAVLSIIAGLNTRLPALIQDISAGNNSNTQVFSSIEGAVGMQTIHIVSTTPEISARRFQYSHATPACTGENCFTTKSFKMPSPWIESEYWHEKVGDTVLAIGFSKAYQGESAPTLEISQTFKGYFTFIHIKLHDAKGKLLARYDGKYRSGFPFETEDANNSNIVKKPSVFEYLLHGNLANSLVARLVSLAPSYPLTSFLKKASNLTHPQGTEFGFTLGKPLYSNKPPPSAKVDLEILEDKTYSPAQRFQENPNLGGFEWDKLVWDRVRSERCDKFLIPESKRLMAWYLFANDPTGRIKVKRNHNEFCDPDVIWFLDYVIEKGNMVITKYSINGNFIYRASFPKPTEGFILSPTIKASDGYLEFEWWDAETSASGKFIKRTIKARIKEPSTVHP